MARYRIVCTEQEPRNASHDVAHIVAVGIGNNPDAADGKLTLTQVFEYMTAGHEFFTASRSTGKEASVTKYACKGCGRVTIRSGADSVLDNNLDSLRPCQWK